MAYPLPRWIAHRGGGALAPENTLAGFGLAARLGFKAVEFDVMLTADGVPVLMHDETLKRTTGARGRLADQPWAEVARLDAGAAFHPAYAGEPVPSLEAAIACCARLGLAANVEIKPASGHDAATGTATAAMVDRLWPEGLPVLLSSFSETALAAARDAAPRLPRGLLLRRIPRNWRERLDALGCSALHARADGLDAETLAPLHAAGVPVAAYTVNSPAEAERCFGLGVVALFTDRLDCHGPA